MLARASVSHPKDPVKNGVIPLPSDFTLLQVIPRLETGGAEQTTVDIAAAVQAAGGRAIVASMGGRLAPKVKASGAALAYLPVHSKNPLVVLQNALRLKALIRREGVSLVHVRSRAPAFSALWAARWAGVPLIATYHGIYRTDSALKRWYNGVMTRGDLIIANSAYTRRHVLKEHKVDPAKVLAIPRGVDMARFDPAAVGPERLKALRSAWGLTLPDRRVKMLLAGRLTRWKGQMLAIEAAAKLKVQGIDDFLILLAGDDQGRAAYRAELDAAIRAFGLQNNVRIVGHCDDMPAAYLLADVALAPSLEPEAFGRTAVEPQAMGRPVIAADHGATRETVTPGQTGWLAAPADVYAWASAMGQALALSEQERRRMGQTALERARRLFSVETMCDATLQAYREVLEERR